jgi:hypothetical protein
VDTVSRVDGKHDSLVQGHRIEYVNGAGVSREVTVFWKVQEESARAAVIRIELTLFNTGRRLGECDLLEDMGPLWTIGGDEGDVGRVVRIIGD